MRKLYVLLLLLPLTLSAQNSVKIQKDAEPVKYNKMIFGHFIEHFHTQVYGGIYDPDSRFADEDGFRTDVIEAIRHIKTPIVRWPGGCFVSSYHWLDGVGPARQPSYDKAWQVEDPNTFGTDEFVKWCRKIGAEPFICTNAGTGTEEEMSDWVEYCNLTVGKWGRMRMENGYPEPHDVKCWSIGNENWGGHEVGAKTAEAWGPLVREAAKMMRTVTHDLKLFAAATVWESWTLPLLKTAGQHLDYVSIHEYWDPLQNSTTPSPYIKCMMLTDGPERTITKTMKILDKAGYGDGKIKIAFDEWNLRSWHHPKFGDFRAQIDVDGRKNNDVASTYTMADALFSACFLNSCLRHADVVDIACFSPIVNTRGPLYVHKDGILKRTTYHVFDMYVNCLEDYVCPVKVKAEKIKHDGESTSVVDCVLTTDEKKTKYTYAAVNKSPDQSISVDLGFKELGLSKPEKVKALVLSGSSPDDYNDIGAEERVIPVDMELKVTDGKVVLPPHSLSILFL
jgi:alpha-N-arabinofuranosidase